MYRETASQRTLPGVLPLGVPHHDGVPHLLLPDLGQLTMTISFNHQDRSYTAEVLVADGRLDEILSVEEVTPSGAIYEVPDPLALEAVIEEELTDHA